MDSAKEVLYIFLISIGCIAYMYGIFRACYVSWPKPQTGYEYVIPAFLSTTVTSISAVLSTNFGAVMGLTLKADVRFSQASLWNPLNIVTNPSATSFQIVACYVYILSLLGTAVVWAHRDFEAENGKIVPLVADLTKTLVGIIVGALAIALNV